MDVDKLLRESYQKLSISDLYQILLDFPKLTNENIVFGIEGASGSGKTTMAKSLLEKFTSDKAIIIALDDYVHLTKEEMEHMGIYTRYSWKSRDADAFVRDIQSLRQGRSITKKVQDYLNEQPSDTVEELGATDYIIIEGNLDISEFCDVTIFLYASDGVLLSRRKERDRQKIIHADQDTYQRSIEQSLVYYHTYLEPCMNKADIIIHTETNTIYKKHS